MARRVGYQNAWTPEEDEKLKAVLLAGKGLTLAALKLRRTKSAVQQRAAKLRISTVDGRKLREEAETIHAGPQR